MLTSEVRALRLLAVCAHASGIAPRFTCPRTLTPEEWETLRQDAKEHGLTSALYAAIPFFDPPPEALRAHLQRSAMAEAAKSAVVEVQLRALCAAFQEADIDLIVLKGGSFLFWLYRNLGSREVSDLDLLIREQDLKRTRVLLESHGFQSQASYGSAAAEQANAYSVGIAPYVKPDHIPLEVHLGFLSDATSSRRAAAEVWERAVPLLPGARRMCGVDALVHAASHYEKHLNSIGQVGAKWLLDILLLWQLETLPRETLRETAARWGVAESVETILGSLTALFHLPYSLADAPAAADAGALVWGVEESNRIVTQGAPKYYWTQLKQLAELPTWRLRAKLLAGFVFPSANNVRYQLGLSAHDSVSIPQHARRWGMIAKRIASAIIRLDRTTPTTREPSNQPDETDR